MKIEFAKKLEKKLKKSDSKFRKMFFEKLDLFIFDRQHPSLRIKKMQGYANPEIWELSLNMDFRATFEIRKDETIFFRKIGGHDILLNP